MRALPKEVVAMTPDYWLGRRVLVTGANGSIGGWLIETLIGHGAVVAAYDRSPDGALDLHPGLKDRIQLVLGELTDQPKLEAVLSRHRIQTLFHLGAQSNIGFAKLAPTATFDS